MRAPVIGYAARRFGHLCLVWVGISLLASSLGLLAPGDPAEILLERRSGVAPTAEEVHSMRRDLGLDAPFPVRYLRWVGDAARGDLGTSYRSGEPVTGELGARFLLTAQLALAALLLGLLIALPLGVLSATRRDSPLDHAARCVALLGTSVPSFWLAYVLVLLFAVGPGWLPVTGRGGWAHLVLPTLTLAVAGAGGLTRLTRAAMLEELTADYVRTARAKGLPERQVVVRHALRNALGPLVTLSGLNFGRLLAGAVVVETVFAWPGLGSYVVDAVFDRDYPAVQGVVLFTGTVFLLLNWLVDLVYAWLDPRVRLGAAPGAPRR